MAKKAKKSSGKKEKIVKTETPEDRLKPIQEFLKSWKGFLLLGIITLIILTILQGPFVFQKKVPAGVDVVAGVGKAHQIMEYQKETGDLPLWNPYVFGGMPYYHFIPPKAISLDNVIRVFRFIIHPDIILFIIGVLSLFGLLLYLGISPLFAFLLSLMMPLWPHFHALIVVGHFMKFRALMYVPLLLLTFIYFLDKPTILSMSLFALVLTLQMRTQHYQIVFYGLLALFFIGLIYLIQWIRQKESKKIIRFAGLFVVSMIFIVLSIAQPTLITREYAKYSTRSGKAISLQANKQHQGQKGVGIDYAVKWSLAPSEILDLFVPRLHGGTSTEIYDGKAVVQWKGQKLPLYWGQMPFTQSYEYMGILLIMLALLGIVARWNSSNVVRGLTIVLVVSFLLALGRHFLPFYKLFFYYVPYFDKFRVPQMIVTLIFYLFIILSAYGASAIPQLIQDEKGKKVLINILGIGALLFVIALIYKLQASFITGEEITRYQQNVLKALQDARREIATRGLMSTFLYLLIYIIIFVLLIKKKIQIMHGIAILLLIQLLDVFPMSKRYMHEHAEYKDPEMLKKNVFVRTDLENTLLEDKTYYRIYPFGPLFQSNQWSYYFASIGGYDAAKMQTIQNLIENNLMFPLDGKIPINWNVLDILNVKYVFLNREFSDSRLEKVVADRIKGIVAYRYKNWKPRIFPVRRIKKVQNQKEVLQQLNLPSFKADSIALVTEAIQGNFVYPDSFSAQITEYTPNKITADIYTSSNAFVVVSEMWYPRWKAKLDEKEIPIYRVDHAIRGVVVPQGQHQIVMEFDASTFHRAALFSWIGLILIYFGIGYGVIRARGVLNAK